VITAELRRRNALAAVGRLTNLPALSESAGRLLAAIGRNHIDIAVLVDIIGRDPVIAARVLKVANSPYYGFERQIDSVHRAVVMLGLDVVRNIAVASRLAAMDIGATPVLQKEPVSL
jgi:HD-like signal output (HDOD) protein